MNKIIIFIISILFFVNRENVVIVGINAINIWCKKLFPLLFPTFILNDLILSSDIVLLIIKYFGDIYSYVFRINCNGVFVFFMSMISGTPSNAKNIYELYKRDLIDMDDITRILCTCYFYNPLFIITFLDIKILIIIYISNILASIILNINRNISNKNKLDISIRFDLSSSINNNINILLNILGTITVFMVLSAIIPINNIYLKVLLSGLLEVTTGISLISALNPGNIVYFLILSMILSFGGLSFFYQIKSILKDTFIDYRYFIINRFLTFVIMFILMLTQMIL